ncbi:UNVERIFIED_ORG: hypothetical protein BDU10_2522 [Burkholderia sp. CF145]
MAYFFAYGTELVGNSLLAGAEKVAARQSEPVSSGAPGEQPGLVPASEGAEKASRRSAPEQYVFPIATACIEDAILAFRQREGVNGPVADLLEEHDGTVWGIVFEVTDETAKNFCQSFDPDRTCAKYPVKLLSPLEGASGASFDVSASIGQKVEASCLVAKDRKADFMSIDEQLMRKLLASYAARGAPPAVLARLIPKVAQSVADVRRGKEDMSERLVCEIYYKVPPRYAVYRSSERVIVQHADDGELGDDSKSLANAQRARMAVLNPLRSQITGLIDGWERSKKKSLAERARRYNARVAAALNQCLEGDQTSPLTVLTEVRDEIVAERASWGRFLYLLSALCAAIVFCIIFWVLKSTYFKPTQTGGLWLAARAGTIGAFFSIAMNIQQRKVLTDLLTRDNVADSALRITVGAIGAGVLLCFLQSGFTPLANFGNAVLAGDKMSWQVILVIGFAAGFSERLVPTIVEKFSAQDGSTPASRGTPAK